MAIPLSDYNRIFAAPGRSRRGDEGFPLSQEDERILTEARAEDAARRGVKPKVPVTTPEQIREHYERSK